MSHKRLTQNVIMNIVRVMSGILIPLITYPYVTRVLGPQNLGKVDFVTSLINYFILFSSLGIPSYGIIVCAKCRSNIEELKKTVSELIYISLFLQILTYIIFGITIMAISNLKGYRSLLYVQSLSIFFTALSLDWLYSALEEFTYITIRTVIIKILALMAIFVFIKSEKDYVIYALILVLSTVFSSLVNLWNARKYITFYKIVTLNIKRHIKPIFIFFMASIAATINGNTDITMLGFFSGDVQVGIYSFSVKLKTLMTTVITAALSVFLPRFSFLIQREKMNEYKKLWSKTFEYTMVIAAFITAFCIFFSKDILLILGGEKYIEALIPMCILICCVYILALTWTLGVGVLQPIGREKKYAATLLIACVVNISLNALLIPKYQAIGAATATLITECMNAVMFYIFSKDIVKNEIDWLNIILLTVIGVGTGYLTQVTVERIAFGNRLMKIIGAGAIDFILYVMLILITNLNIRNDVKEIVRTVKMQMSK